MGKHLCNACVLQNWTFDSREEAEAWIRRQQDLNWVEVLFSDELCGNGWHLTVSRRYNSVPMTQPGQIATIGALIAGFEFDHVGEPAADPEVE